MSDRHRDRGEHRRHRSRSRSKSPDWRKVRVKEEPLSDVEGQGQSRQGHGRSHPHHPPSSSSSNSRDRGEYDRRGHGSSGGSRRRSRSRSRDRDRGGSRDHRHDRDRGERPPPRIKSEPRSRSRSPGQFVRPPPRHQKDDHGRNRPSRPQHDQGSDRDHRRSDDDRRPPPQRDVNVKRERDWDNFFNPESDMSREAIAKREQRVENEEREQQVEQFDKDGNKIEQVEKEKPNFGLSGKLTEETNTYRGVVIKYSEPPEARKPIKTRWRLYPFKDGEPLEVMYIHRQSAYLLGRERKIADIPIDHPSCSKQHAVIQYRLVPYEKPNGLKGRRIRPYVIDLESANGTLVNGKKIDPKRYFELFEKDVLKFGFSSREYVLLHEHSKDDDPLDDDGYDKSPSPE